MQIRRRQEDGTFGPLEEVFEASLDESTMALFDEITSQQEQLTTQLADTASKIDSISTFAESFGAKGDNATIDSDALQKALDKGGIVTLKKNAIYLVDRLLVMKPNSTIDGNGATIKRINSNKTTISSNISEQSAGSKINTFTVQDASGFRVGNDVVIHKSDGTFLPYNHRITAINGNSITINRQGSTTLVGTYGVGDFMTNSSKLIQMYDNCTIRDLKIDGNKDNNSIFPRWQTANAIISWSNCLIEHVRILNESGEAIVQYLDNSTIRDSYMQNIGGNGIHFSGANNITVDNNTIKDTNLISGVGHEDGNLCWSNECQDIKITNCYLENGKSAFGSIDYGLNSNVLASNNTIKNQRTSAVDMDFTYADSAPSNIVFANNKFYNSKSILIKDTGKVNYSKNVIFIGNLFLDTIFDVINTNNLLITSNVFDFSQILNVLSLTSSKATISNNRFLKGNYALLSYSSQLIIQNNSFEEQVSGAIVENDTNGACDSIINNNIVVNTTGSATLNLIICKAKSLVSGNKINANTVKYAIYVCGNGAIVNNNYVRVITGEAARLDNGYTDVIIERNYLTKDVSKGSVLNNCIIENNRIIA